MSRYDGLIIPRSYSEYINKTDAATLQQALQLSGVLSKTVASGDSKAVTSNAVNGALADLHYTEPSTQLSVDADTLMTSGHYYIVTPTMELNYPVENWGVMEVIKGGTNIVQKYFPDTGSSEYCRQWQQSYGWTDWVIIATTSDLDNYEKTVGTITAIDGITSTDVRCYKCHGINYLSGRVMGNSIANNTELFKSSIYPSEERFVNGVCESSTDKFPCVIKYGGTDSVIIFHNAGSSVAITSVFFSFSWID